MRTLLLLTVQASKIVSERKAVVTVASVVVAFAVCWVPYFSVFVIKPFVSSPVGHVVDQLTLWLGYANSSVCLLYTSPSPRDRQKSRMPSSA